MVNGVGHRTRAGSSRHIQLPPDGDTTLYQHERATNLLCTHNVDGSWSVLCFVRNGISDRLGRQPVHANPRCDLAT